MEKDVAKADRRLYEKLKEEAARHSSEDGARIRDDVRIYSQNQRGFGRLFETCAKIGIPVTFRDID